MNYDAHYTMVDLRSDAPPLDPDFPVKLKPTPGGILYFGEHSGFMHGVRISPVYGLDVT